MALSILDGRIIIKRSTTAAQTPTVAPSNDHTDGSWTTLDIYKGELFINTADDLIFMRTDSGIIKLNTIPLSQANAHNWANASGTDTYTATLTPALTAYTAGNCFLVKFANANTGASTINFNGLGAKTLKKAGAALAASDIINNGVYLIGYDGTDFHLLGAGGSGTGVTDGDKGDITVSGSGTTWNIDNGVVSLAKMADVATSTVFYRKTASTGAPEVQTLATLKTDLGLTGTNSGDQTITLSGVVSGSGTGAITTTFVSSTGSGAVVLATSPALAGTPTAPTAASGTSSTQVATTAFVQNAVATPTAAAYLFMYYNFI